jgi:steroid delta-isomerase-like uncharacterized protein
MRNEGMNAKKNEEIVTRYFEEIWNSGNLNLLDEIISPQYINHSPGSPNPKPGPSGLRPIIEAIRKAFPDLNYKIVNMVATDTQVAIHTKMSGTHLGDLFGLAPTGKKVNVNQMQIERMINGQIVEHWRVTDDLTFLKELGQIK